MNKNDEPQMPAAESINSQSKGAIGAPSAALTSVDRSRPSIAACPRRVTSLIRYLGATGPAPTTQSVGARAGNSARKRTLATPTPTSCITMNIGAHEGSIPAKVSLNARPTVTAGLAKLVDEVK